MGFDSMAAVLELLYESGVSCATVYAFLIENFKRLKTEVDWLMDLAKSKLMQISQNGELCDKYGIRVRILGNFAFLPDDVNVVLKDIMHTTRKNTRATLNVCFPYTSRDEMAHAIRTTAEDANKDSGLDVDEHTLTDHMYTAGLPPLDLLIRTSGTYRLSDFLLWQCVPSLCAIVFSDRLWPEFTPWDMTKILFMWSFNKYWYGHGNGQTMRRVVDEPLVRAMDRTDLAQSLWDSDASASPTATSTGYKVYASSPSDASDITAASVVS